MTLTCYAELPYRSVSIVASLGGSAAGMYAIVDGLGLHGLLALSAATEKLGWPRSRIKILLMQIPAGHVDAEAGS